MKHRFIVAEGDKKDFYQQKRQHGRQAQSTKTSAGLRSHMAPSEAFQFFICENVKIYMRAI